MENEHALSNQEDIVLCQDRSQFITYEMRHEIAQHLHVLVQTLMRAMQLGGHDNHYRKELGGLYIYLAQLSGDFPATPGVTKRFTAQEYRIANLIRDGLRSHEIAKQLQISVETVRTHRRNMRRKLRLTDPAQPLRAYLQGSSLLPLPTRFKPDVPR